MELQRLVRGLVFLGVAVAGCSSSMSTEEADLPDAAQTPDATIDPNRADRLPADDDGCPGIYAQDRFPTFELEIDADAWAGLEDKWYGGMEWDSDTSPLDDSVFKTYEPLAKFKWQDVVITTAAVRLRGNPSYWHEQQKMQLQVSFNRYDKKGRFLGLRKLAFDAASANRSFLRDRLALHMMRSAGIEAPCANNARVFINGEYYGLFTSIEKIDKEFLQRVFEDPDGDLWKRANWELKTNEDESDDSRLRPLRDATTPDQIYQYLELEQAIRVWAVDAIIPNSDGPWAGGLNFYLYDDPSRGKFIVLPWDLDNTFTRLPKDVDPYVWKKDIRFHGRPFYDISLQDEQWFDTYIESISELNNTVYDYETLLPLIDQWALQIRDAAFADPNKPFDNSKHLERLDILRAFVELRHRFLDDWLACWQAGGVRDTEGYCVGP